jgi:hypothetical protein
MQHRRGEEPLEVDESMWPLLLLTFPRVVTESTVRRLIAAYETAFQRATRFIAVCDGTAIAKFPGAAERKILVDWMTTTEGFNERERKWTLGTGVVVPSGTMRALVAAFNLIRRPISPQQWTATLVEALDWSHARFVGAGISPNPRLDEMRTALRAQRRKPAG